MASRSDLGRIQRQQSFLLSALNQAQGALGQNPLLMSSLLNAASASLTLDSSLTLAELNGRFRDLAGDHLERYALPVTGVTIDQKAVLNVDIAAAEPILAYFRGETSEPPMTVASWRRRSWSAPQRRTLEQGPGLGGLEPSGDVAGYLGLSVGDLEDVPISDFYMCGRCG